MTSSEGAAPAIFADRVVKDFELPTEQVHTLKERALHPFRRSSIEQLHALREVSLSVQPGEFFGITGRNGSGKSTLLKCLAGIYAVDSGAIYVRGQVSTFIELGVGFNPDLAATDNILLNATMLGLSPREARRRVDAVLDFAELREFADLKIKNYSSGMLVRLAFSVMIQVDAEVLLIDEVLAVGDAAFQQKCFEEFERIRASHKTVLFVTHDMAAIRRFCDRAMLLERGRVVTTGTPEDVGNRYLQLNFSEAARQAEAEAARDSVVQGAPTYIAEEGDRLGDGRAEITEAWFEDDTGAVSQTLISGRPASFAMRVRFSADVRDPLFSMSLRNSAHQQLLSSSTVWEDSTPGLYRAGEEATYRVRFDNILGADRYQVTAAVTLADGTMLDLRERFFSVHVTQTRSSGALVDVPQDVSVTRSSAEVQR